MKIVKGSVNEMRVDKMRVDKMRVDKMRVDDMGVDKMGVDEMSVDKMRVKLPVSSRSAGGGACWMVGKPHGLAAPLGT